MESIFFFFKEKEESFYFTLPNFPRHKGTMPGEWVHTNDVFIVLLMLFQYVYFEIISKAKIFLNNFVLKL